jgi:hypothetical protein
MHTDQFPPNNEVSPESLRLGHEPDVVKPSRILYVAAALVILFAFTYVVVTLIVKYTITPAKVTPGDPAQARYKQPQDQGALNKRLERISSTDPNAVVKQPRLEGLQALTHTDEKPYFRSSPPVDDTGKPLEQKVNAPQYHPEELRPDGHVAKELGLMDFHWKDKEKTRVAIPLNEAIKLLAEGSHEKDDKAPARALYLKYLKSDNKVDLKKINAGRPTASTPTGTLPTLVEGKHDHDHPKEPKH